MTLADRVAEWPSSVGEAVVRCATGDELLRVAEAST